jgi:hypothetical protein
MLFGSTVLEVALGLMFVYLLLSLLCSAVGEYIEAKLNSRARYLQEGIRLLLNETDGTGIDLAERLYTHGLVRPLYRNAAKLPSYIPSRTFALALWNMATSAAADAQAPAGNVGVTSDLKRIREAVETQIPNQELKTALLTLIDEANGDLARARKNVEDWYDARSRFRHGRRGQRRHDFAGESTRPRWRASSIDCGRGRTPPGECSSSCVVWSFDGRHCVGQDGVGSGKGRNHWSGEDDIDAAGVHAPGAQRCGVGGGRGGVRARERIGAADRVGVPP